MTNLESPPLQPEQSPPPVVTETTVTIMGDVYRVRRVAVGNKGGGFAMIYDSGGRNILTYPASFPAQHDNQIINAWRAGRQIGLKAARR